MRTFIDDVAGTVMEIVASPAPCGLREQGASGEELQPAKQASKNEQKKVLPMQSTVQVPRCVLCAHHLEHLRPVTHPGAVQLRGCLSQREHRGILFAVLASKRGCLGSGTRPHRHAAHWHTARGRWATKGATRGRCGKAVQTECCHVIVTASGRRAGRWGRGSFEWITRV